MSVKKNVLFLIFLHTKVSEEIKQSDRLEQGGLLNSF